MTESVSQGPISTVTPTNGEEGTKFKRKQVEAGVRMILQGLGVDLEDENFKETPARVARAYYELCSGLYSAEKKTEEIFGKSFFSDYRGMIVVGPVQATGVCPHHLLPVKSTVVMGYIPKERKLGLSKLARAIKLYLAKPVMQESASHALVEAFQSYVQPDGVALYIQAKHGCMTDRGVLQHNCEASTMDVRGLFKDDSGVKTEFTQQVRLLLRRS